MTSPSHEPDINELICCANDFAVILAREPAIEFIVQEKMEEILFKRKLWQAYQTQIVTQDEVVDTVIAHLYTMLTKDVDATQDKEPWKEKHLNSRIREALFGTRTT